MSDAIAAFFASGRAVDVVLAFMAVEVVALALWRRRTGGGVPPGDLLWITASGVFLMIALRTALTGGGWPGVALGLCGSLVSHLMDLRQRWTRPPG
ncbi:hypothetical protein [Alsobacter sp. R-9]